MDTTHHQQEAALEAIEPFPRGAMVHFAHKLCNGLACFLKEVRIVGSNEFELKDLDRHYELIQDFRIPREDMAVGDGASKLRKAYLRVGVLARFCLQYRRATSNIIRRRPDYVLVATVFRYPMMSYFLGRMKRNGIRCLQICHEFQMREERKRLSSRLLFLSNRNVYAQFHAIFFLSESQRSEFKQANPGIDADRLFVIRHGNGEIFGDLKSTEPSDVVARRYGIDPDRPTILFFGRIRRDKGVEDVVEALQLIKQQTDLRPQLLLAGHTPADLARSLKDQIDRSELASDVVIFPEYVPMSEVWHLLSVSSLAVFPYRSSSQSGALQTAMACGKPVIVSSVGGLPEVISHEQSGLVVPPSAPHELKDAMLRILSDPDLADRLGQAALKESQTTYGWKTVAKQMIDAVDKLEGHPAASERDPSKASQTNEKEPR